MEQRPQTTANNGKRLLNETKRMKSLALPNGTADFNLCRMNWKENIARWRALPPEEKLRRNWEAIPLDVAQSMAFEREPVPVERIRATLARIEPPALLKPLAAPSATRN